MQICIMHSLRKFACNLILSAKAEPDCIVFIIYAYNKVYTVDKVYTFVIMEVKRR